MVAFRRDTNVQDMLVHKKHNKLFNKRINQSRPCSRNCALCKHMITTERFEDTRGNKYSVDGNINCETANLVYGIYCNECEKIVYVGETGTSLYNRMQNHMSTIRKNDENEIGTHFNSEGHSLDSFRVIGLEKTNKSWIYRREKEQFWIHKLNTLDENGLNKKGR